MARHIVTLNDFAGTVLSTTLASRHGQLGVYKRLYVEYAVVGGAVRYTVDDSGTKYDFLSLNAATDYYNDIDV